MEFYRKDPNGKAEMTDDMRSQSIFYFFKKIFAQTEFLAMVCRGRVATEIADELEFWHCILPKPSCQDKKMNKWIEREVRDYGEKV